MSSDTEDGASGAICRVCHTEGTPEQPLRHPCRCAGTIRFVHQDCLMEWLKHSKKRYCELCRYSYTFQPVYADNMPARLPVVDIAVGLLRQAFAVLRTYGRIVLVALVWGLILPVIARWTWALFLEDDYTFSIPESSTEMLRQLVWTWVEGSVVGAGIFCLGMGLLGLRDFIVANELPFVDPLGEVDLAVDDDDEDDEEEVPVGADEHRAEDSGGEADLPPELEDDPEFTPLEGSSGEEGAPFGWNMGGAVMDPFGELRALGIHVPNFEDYFDDDEQDGEQAGAPQRHRRHHRHDRRRHPSDSFDHDDYDDDEEEDDTDDSAEWETEEESEGTSSAVRSPPFGDGSLSAAYERGLWNFSGERSDDGYENEEDDEDADDEDEDQAAGAVGGLSDGDLSEPEAGRRVVEGDHDQEQDQEREEEEDGDDEDDNEDDNVVQLDEEDDDDEEEEGAGVGIAGFDADALGGQQNEPQEWPLELIIGLDGPIQTLVDTFLWVCVINLVAVLLFVWLPMQLGKWVLYFAGVSQRGTVVLATVGYVVCSSVLLIRYGIFGSRHHKRTAFGRFICFLGLFLKVCFLLGCEVVLCPILTGWWVDITTLELQQSTLKQHQTFFMQAPWTSTFLHWLAGMLAMHNVASFVALLRDVLKPGVLWFLRDPNNPEFHPIKQMLELPLLSYTRRLVSVFLLYGVLVLLLVYMPVQTCLLLSPKLFPFNIILAHPLELLTFNFLVPFVQENIDPANSLKQAVTSWVSWVATLLGLRSFLLPADETPVAEAAAGAVDNGADQEDGIVAEAARDDAEAQPRLFTVDGTEIPPAPTPGSSQFVLRIAVFLFLSWFALFCFITGVLSLPVITGRHIVGLITSMKVHELYTFLLGGGAIVFGAKGLVLGCTVPVQTITSAVAKVRRYTGPVLKLIVAVTFAGLVLPLQVGILVDLMVFAPFKAPGNSTPVRCYWHCWAIGMMLLKVLIQIDLDPPNNNTHQARLRAAMQNGIWNIDLKALVQALFPIFAVTNVALVLPEIFCFGVLKYMAGLTPATLHWLYRLIFPAYFCIFCLTVALGLVIGSARRMYTQVLDSKYLVGQRLLNYEETQRLASRAEGAQPAGAAPT